MKFKFPLFIFALLMLYGSVQAQMMRIRTVAGDGDQGYGGDGGSAAAATLSGPLGVAVDAFGNIYIQDFYNFRVRKVNRATGTITTMVGTGVPGYTGNGSISSSATITPYGIALDAQGNLYISDASYSVVRKVNGSGIISTIAGNTKVGYTGDGGAATNARLSNPYGITLDTMGNLYIADAAQHVVRRVSKTGIISTVAGNDTAGYIGDGGAATDARLDSPFAVAIDWKGNLYINDHKNNVIRKVDKNNIISTYAGNGIYNYAGDNGPATAANLNAPQGLAIDTIGNLYIADAENDVIRKVDTFGIITTVVGDGSRGFGGDDGYAVGANLHNPYAVAVDKYGDIYVADANNQRIRMTYNPGLAVTKYTLGSGIGIYPNPATDNIVVAGLNPSDKVCVYDLAGKQVSDVWNVTNNGPQTFTIRDIAPGLYMLQVWDNAGNKIAVAKLVKE